ncbi:MAG: hypothetical protein ACI33J_05870 [Clostridium sp.]
MKKMINTIKISFKVSFIKDANAFIHFLYNVPILKKILPNNLYENTDTKLILAFVKMFLNIFLTLFKKSLYIGVFILIPCILISNFLGLNEFDSNIALQSFIFLNFILGSFLNNVVFNTVIEENYIMIKLMRMDSRTYYLSQILFKIIIELIFFIPSLLFLRIGFFNVLLLLLELSAFRFIINSLLIFFYKKWNFIFSSDKSIISFLFVAIFLLAYIPQILGIVFNCKAVLFSPFFSIPLILLGILCTTYSFLYNGYNSISQKVLSRQKILDVNLAIDDINTSDVKLNKKKIYKDLMNTEKFNNKKGFDYLNSLFFYRHYNLVKKNITITTGIIIIIFTLISLLVLFDTTFNKNNLINIITNLSFYVIIVNFICNRESLCKAMFFNCDVALLRYGYYKNADNILRNFTSRLKKMLLYNSIPIFSFMFGLLILLILCDGVNGIIKVIPIFICIVLLYLFFSIYHLFMYYIFQPYTSKFETKSPLFSIINFVVYMLCLNISKVELNNVIFNSCVAIITIIFIPFSLIIIYKFAPKTFRLK